VSGRARRSRAGGARKLPARYTDDPPSEALADTLRLHRRGAHERALARYADALRTAPDALDAWLNRGALLCLRGHAREGAQCLRRALAHPRADARAHRDAGIALGSIGHSDESLRALEHAVALDPALVGARLALVRALGEHGLPERAREESLRVVERAPDEPSAWTERHRALFDPANPEPALACAERAVALAPNDPDAHVLLAGARALAGRSDLPPCDPLGPEGLLDPRIVDALRTALAMVREGATPFAYKRALIEHAIDARTHDGPVLEFGVRHGISLRVLAARCARVHGFDSFEGLPAPWQGRGTGAFSTAGEPPEDLPPNVTLHPGWFEQTALEFVGTMTEPPSLIHIDSDLYESARSALTALGPRIEPGCVLLFDEYLGNASWREDEFRAAREAALAWGWRLEPLAVSWITGQAALRVHRAG
jgi:tetratricopeptide (TPR) repeat protein